MDEDATPETPTSPAPEPLSTPLGVTDAPQDTTEGPVPASPPVSAPRRPAAALKVAAAAILVLAIAGLGFVVGHYVAPPRATVTAGQRQGFPSFPSGGYSGSGGYINFPGFGNFPGAPTFTTPASSSADAAAAKIAKSVDPGLVDITSNLSYQGGEAEGTGMVLTSNGLVLTNNHVVEGATTLSATDVATGVTYQATVVGYDVGADVALLQLKDASGLATVTTGDSSALTTGEKVVGIGNAGGVGGTPSYAAGTVVALNQSITASDEGNPAGSEQLSGLIEVNADIQPGDSGGPLVNTKGRVVGMDTAGSSTNGSFGFEATGSGAAQGYAIPINAALAIVKSIEKGDATSAVHVGPTAFLGVGIDATGSADGGYPSPTPTSGVTIAEAFAGEPAANAGLVAGDVITSIDGQAVTTASQLQQEMLTLHAGQTVTVDYVSTSGATATASVTLGSGPAQ